MIPKININNDLMPIAHYRNQREITGERWEAVVSGQWSVAVPVERSRLSGIASEKAFAGLGMDCGAREWWRRVIISGFSHGN